ncbi:MAG: hypothetical protein ABIJ91_01850 [Candidatus Kuenenbacteria bacterium]
MYKCPSCGTESPNPGKCDGCDESLEKKCDDCGFVNSACECDNGCCGGQ